MSLLKLLSAFELNDIDGPLPARLEDALLAAATPGLLPPAICVRAAGLGPAGAGVGGGIENPRLWNTSCAARAPSLYAVSR